MVSYIEKQTEMYVDYVTFSCRLGSVLLSACSHTILPDQEMVVSIPDFARPSSVCHDHSYIRLPFQDARAYATLHCVPIDQR